MHAGAMFPAISPPEGNAKVMTQIQTESCVLRACSAVGGERFTLRQVVRRIASDHPEIIPELPAVWARLMESHRVQVMNENLGGLYRIVR